jgi:hypothetical protein
MRRCMGLALTVLAGLSAPAVAQDGWGWSVIIPSVTGTDQLGLHLRDQLARQKSSPQAPAAGRPATSAAPAALRYIPSKERRAANLKSFADRIGRVDPAGARQLQALFASGDVIDRMGALIRPHGFRVDDLGDVYAVWWITTWQATRGRNDDPSAAASAAVRQQAHGALGATPALLGGGDATRQQLAESLLLHAMLIDAAVDQAKGSPQQMQAVGKAAAQGAKAMGLDMATMQLTETGFVTG